MRESGSFYYAALLWAALLYGAGVVFKFGTVFLYQALMPWFSDEEPPERKKAEPPPHAKMIVWRGLGVYLLLAGLVQIPPQVALAPRDELLRLATVRSQLWIAQPLARGWVAAWSLHSITYNIVTFMVESVLGIFLLTEHDTWLGRITAGLTGIWGLLVAIFPQGLGFIFSHRNSLLSGAPGSGLLVALMALLLLMPNSVWRTDALLHGIRLFWTAAFGLGTLQQLTFFSGPRLAGLYASNHTLPQPPILLAAIHVIKTASLHNPIPINALWVMLFAAAAAAGLLTRRVATTWIITLVLLAVWWLGQDFGLPAQFGLNLNTAPLWGILLWAMHQSAQPSSL